MVIEQPFMAGHIEAAPGSVNHGGHSSYAAQVA
jgi:hypothetical protein